MNTDSLYYDLHAGFPRLEKKDGNSNALTRSEIVQRLNKVSADTPIQTEGIESTIVDVGGEQCFAEHAVPGTLDLLSTHRYTDFNKALEGLNQLRKEFSGHSSIRFELEEVLTSAFAEDHRKIHPYDLTIHDFSDYNPILRKPIFEIHLSIRRRNNDLKLSINWNDIAKIAHSLDIRINEFLCFNNNQKITTTTFFPMLGERNPSNLDKHFNAMNHFFVHDAQRLAAAITESDPSIQIKKIAERILLVTQPK
ncbi:MAG: hypothetical protein K9L79_06630 [Methylobacter tundripaludum]|nr:hypothetical protein [Methylobacter tundripaludum]